jgi:hypothetical protein
MAYNYKYKVEWVGLKTADNSQFYYRLEFYKKEDIDIVYEIINLKSSEAPFVLNYKSVSDFVFEPFRTSFAEINLFFDENTLVEPKDFYSNNDDITFKVKFKLINVIEETETELWQGYILNDDIEYEWQQRYYLRMSAIDNISILKKYEYSDPTTYSMYLDADIYNGISVKDFIIRCLGYSGNELNIKFDIRRKYGFPQIDKNEESIFLNEYSAINWSTKRPKEIYKLLSDVLRSFGCILYQDNRDNSWTVLTINSLGTEINNIVPMNKYDSNGVFIESLNYDISGSINQSGNFIWSDTNQIVTLRPSLNTVRIELPYQRKNLINNYGFFKDGLTSSVVTDWEEIGTFPVLTVFNPFAQYDNIMLRNAVNSINTVDYSNYLRYQFFLDDAQKWDNSQPFKYQLYLQFDFDTTLTSSGNSNYALVSFGELDNLGNFNTIRDDGSWITGTSPSITTFIALFPYGNNGTNLDGFRALTKIKQSTDPLRFFIYLRPNVRSFASPNGTTFFDNMQLNFIPLNYQTVEKIYYTSYNFADSRRVGERNIKTIKDIQYHGGWRASDVLTYEDIVMIKNDVDILISGKNWYRAWEQGAEETQNTFTNGLTSSILSFHRGVGKIFTGNVYAEQTPIIEVPFAFPMYLEVQGTINNEINNQILNQFEGMVIADSGTVETTYCGSNFLDEFNEVNSKFFMHEASFDYFTNKTNVKLYENFTDTSEIFSQDYGVIRGNQNTIGEIGSTTFNTQTEEITEG